MIKFIDKFIFTNRKVNLCSIVILFYVAVIKLDYFDDKQKRIDWSLWNRYNVKKHAYDRIRRRCI